MSGRPTSFTPDLGDLICSLLAEGQSLRKICKLDSMPHLSTVMDWLMKGTRGDDRYRAFAEQYACAREAQAELYADEIIDIADDDTRDRLFVENQDGETRAVVNAEFVQRSRLRIDSRKWVAAKLLPKKYGDRVQANLSDGDGNPLNTTFTIHVGAPPQLRRLTTSARGSTRSSATRSSTPPATH